MANIRNILVTTQRRDHEKLLKVKQFMINY